ncbi:hypothetical protein ACP70R_024323 [Stipagrostis hirtigluma subsp. patula]
MASALLRSSVRWGSSVNRVRVASSGGEGLAVSLPPSPLRRLLSSGAQGDQPPKSTVEQIIAQIDEILATRTITRVVALDIFISSILARREAFNKELSRSFSTSMSLVAGGLVGYTIYRAVH